MDWMICFFIAISVLALAVFIAVALGIGKYKRGRVLSPLNVLFAGLFISVFVSLLPLYKEIIGPEAYESRLKAVAFSLHNTYQIFTIDSDHSIILENIVCKEQWLANAYSVYLSVVFVVAPILTFGFLVSFFKNLSSYFRYLLRYFSDAYIFSELNEKSVTLAADIKKNHKRSLIVFADVFENNEESSYELVERARELRAICFKKDIMAINFKHHYSRAQICFFTIGKDETENLKQSLKLIEQYLDRDRTRLYSFSTGVEGDLLLAKADKGGLKVRRVNQVRSLINRILYEDGAKIFENASPAGDDGIRNISAVIVGMGRNGTEMLKALTWFCQMDGYRIKIDAFDSDPLAEERFAAAAPELMSEKYNGKSVPGDTDYSINIHAGIDVTTKTFYDEISKLADATYVLVSLGSDADNISAAVNLRTLFERMKIKPVIQAVVTSSEEKHALEGAANFKGEPYCIDYIGDIESSYSEKVIISSELEADALARHLKWGPEEDFWRYEYNYRSSVASAIHMKARIACGIAGAVKSGDELSEEERVKIEKLEHRRWNAYMRSEGYVYSGSHDKSSRNDLAKMHNTLVPYDELSDNYKRLDSNVGTK